MKLFFASLLILITIGCISSGARNRVITPSDNRIQLESDGTYIILPEGTYIIQRDAKDILICIVIDDENEPCYTEDDLKSFNKK